MKNKVPLPLSFKELADVLLEEWHNIALQQ